MNIGIAGTTLRPAATAPSLKTPYNRASSASANTALLLGAEGFAATVPAAGPPGAPYRPASVAEGSTAQLFGYLGFSPNRGPTRPAVTARGSTFNRATASEAGAAQLFARLGFPTAGASPARFGALAAAPRTTPADYGRGQYEAVAALLSTSTTVAKAVGTGLEGVVLRIAA